MAMYPDTAYHRPCSWLRPEPRCALLDDVKNHIAAAGVEDDVTLVVAKRV